VSSPPVVDDLRQRARTLAATGEWSALCALLAPQRVAREAPDLTTLLAEGFLRTGQARAARTCLGDVLAADTPARDRSAVRRGYNLLGAAAFELGELTEAERAFEHAVDLARAAQDDLLVARATNNLGAIANTQGRRADALLCYQLAVPAYQRLGSPQGLAECFHNMAITYRDTAQLAVAEEYERRAIEFARDAGSQRLLALARLGLAEVQLRRGEAGLARRGALLAGGAFATLDDPARAADALRVVGEATLVLGDVPEARSHLDRALALSRASGAVFNEAEALRALASAALTGGAVEEAAEHARAACAIFARLGAAEEQRALEEWMAGQGIQSRL